ncbi:MAG: pirin family protein [Ignavibacteriales bacterium]|nr:MAG: pirin family protein [Ignavibacteriales bacterium]
MIEVRKSNERGHTKIDWLDSRHSFSFGEYYDPKNIHFGPLRVINDDIIQPGEGFPTHPHRDMEIVTIILEGTVAHKDSSGGEGTITVNEIQRMTAGTGILHSEFNASDTEILKLLQIWFIPNQHGLTPGYEQKKFSHEEKKNKLLKVVSGKKEDGIIFINQDAEIFFSDLEAGIKLNYEVKNNRGVYIQLIDGALKVNSSKIEIGDALKITDEKKLELTAEKNAKMVLFDITLEF